MTKPSVSTLLYATTGARRWVEAAISTPDADLRNLCARQWKRAASIAASAAAENARTLRVGAFCDAVPGPLALQHTYKY
jgi:hypothetical protein